MNQYKIKKIVLLVLISVTVQFVDAQNTFQKAYGNINGGQTSSVTITEDGNYAFAGWYDVNGLFTAEFFLMLTDSSGDTLWTRTYGAKVDSTVNKKNGSGNEGFHAIQTSDRGFMFVGERHEIEGGTSDVFAVKTSRDGTLEWFKTYGDVENEYGFRVKETNDGGYAIAGFTESFGAGGRDFHLLRLDNMGDTLWTRIYGGESIDVANDLIIPSSGGFLMAGTTFSFGAGNSDAHLIRTDDRGNVLWEKTYGGLMNDVGRRIQQTVDGGFILVGETASFGAAVSDLYIVKLDIMGDIEWSKTLGGEDAELGYSVIQTNDGGYAIAGSTKSFGVQNQDAYLVKIDSEGNLLWSSNFGGEFEDLMYDVKQTEDGGYIMAGMTRSFGAGNQDAYIIKTNSLGRSVCNHSQSDYFSVDVNTVSTDTRAQVLSGMTAKRLTTFTGYTNTTQTDICSGIVSTNNLADNLEIKIFPNPSRDFILIDNKVPSNLKIHGISIIDINGHVITQVPGYRLTDKLNISFLTSGIYFLQFKIRSGVYCKKFVKL